MTLKDTFSNCVRAPRPLLAVFFLEVVFGAIYALNFDVFSIDFRKLLLIFFSFQSLYYAIYLTNDIIDYESDRLSKEKQKRPIASGKISRKNAFIFASILIILAFSIASTVSMLLIKFEIFFLTYCLVYSFFLKKLLYIDAFAGGITHAARFVMGISLFGTFNQYYFIASVLMTTSAYTFIKRLKEIEYREDVKHPIEKYSMKKIKMIWAFFGLIILILLVLSDNLEKVMVGMTFMVYALTIIGYLKSKKIKEMFSKASNY